MASDRQDNKKQVTQQKGIYVDPVQTCNDTYRLNTGYVNKNRTYVHMASLSHCIQGHAGSWVLLDLRQVVLDEDFR